MQTIRIENLEAFAAFARLFAQSLRGGEVIGLVGDLGSGKTTFVQHVAEALGVKDAVRSPTFVLMNIYDLPKNRVNITSLCHVDAYRFEKEKELSDIGFEEYAGQPGIVTFVEWADKVPFIHTFPSYREITLIFDGSASRVVRLSDSSLKLWYYLPFDLSKKGGNKR
jgi:tRNA threonylcarbamoyladenosine biosynthesis protein TsaE